MLSLRGSVSLSPLSSEALLKGPKHPPSTPQGKIQREEDTIKTFLAPKGAYEVQMLSLRGSVSLSQLCSEALLKGPKHPPSTP